MGNEIILPIDDRRELIVPGDKAETIRFSAQHWLHTAREAIEKRGAFYVALSGGSTPKAIYQELASQKIDWQKVHLFFSDERCVPPTHSESNFKMAVDSGLPEARMFRMKGELNPEEAAREYDALISAHVPEKTFDLVMLGLGADGHTASLFPKTHGLHPMKREAIANFVPEKDAWRLTLTFDSINQARRTVLYVTGSDKAETLREVLLGKPNPDFLPAQRVGTLTRRALWIADTAAASLIL